MLKVFEAFAGYGSQRLALKANIPHKVVGISEIDGDALLSYAAIHENLLEERMNELPFTENDMREFLENINVPLITKHLKTERKV